MQRGGTNLRSILVTTLALCATFSGERCLAQQPAATPDLPHDVLPLLRTRCVKCHGPMKHESGLNLSSPRSIARGGESGAAVVAEQPADSLLWQRIDSGEMPPEAPLSAEERGLIERWIAAGAPGLPTAAEAAQPGTDHWAFAVPERRVAPQSVPAGQVRNDIDRFVLAELDRRGWTLSPPAPPTVLIRRVAFDLTGLPPTPEEIALYLADAAPDAYERMVDRYLASPRYGERWGQHWLDAAGYADSNGYFNADSDRPLAYRYRDYVIDALNRDKPFDQFLREQIAGDELVGLAQDGDILPEMVEPLVATHFLRNAPDGTGESDGNPDEQRADRFTVLEGTVQILASSLLGLTVQCARCHDHKFEPITQQEYYQLQAILWPAYCPDDWRKPKDRTLEVGTRAAREEHAAVTTKIDAELKALQKKRKEATSVVRKRLADEYLAQLDEAMQSKVRAAIDRKAAERDDEQQQLAKDYDAAVDVSEDALAEKFTEYGTARAEFDRQIEELQGKRPAPLEALAALVDVQTPPTPHHLLVRGDYRALGVEVAPGVPEVLCSAENTYAVPVRETPGSGRRTALAAWLTHPRHPLVARVTVNRIWQQHFGRGLVATADNFGYTGTPPTHPELLDYLAVAFVEGGFRFKALQRMILTSAVYRQSSAAANEVLAGDPENLLLGRFPLLRLDAEGVRDAMLSVSGELDLQAGGPYVPTMRTGTGEVTVATDTPGALRRSVYLQHRRTQTDSMLDVFDAPQGNTNCTRRNASTIALQSLSLLNSEFVTARAGAMAERVARMAGDDPAARIDTAFLIACGRVPTAEERAAAEAFVATQPAAYEGDAEAVSRTWRDFCQMLLASNAFLYIE